MRQRILRLEAYERWRRPTKIDFKEILGSEHWDKYWSLWDALIAEMRRCQDVADELRERIKEALSAK